jgi:VWFA-related protein
MRVALPAVMVALGMLVAASAQEPTFRAGVESVRVDVLVTENRRVVLGLRPSDFEVTDNGVAQTIDLISFEQLPLNVIMAFDLSNSMSGERLNHLRLAAQAVLAGVGGEDRAALLTFNDKLQRPFPLTREFQRLAATLGDLKPEGLTALIDGAYAGLTLAGADAGRDLLLVFSDGVDTVSVLPAARVLDAARRTDVTVYGVTIRGEGYREFLKDLSSDTGGRAVEIQSTTDLQKTFLAILEEFRRRYVLSFTPRGVSTAGWHRLQVRVKGRRPTIVARQGYIAGS